jgi:hypothetical protein
MAAPTCTDDELLKLVKQSGYPFELSVAEALQASGFEVQLSQHFYNSFRQKDSELDILATIQTEASSKTKPKIRFNLELAIECKDNSLPFVLFGFPPPPRPSIDILDMDFRYLTIRTTDDTFPNFMAPFAFGDSREKPPSDFKPRLHQFNSDFRFHHASMVETDGKTLKLHESERLRSALTGLAGYAEHTQNTWMKHKKVLDDMPHDPTLWISFFLLVHNGQHYRYTNRTTLEASNHTPLFTSFNSDINSTFIVIDFIQFSALPSAIKTIKDSFNHLAYHLGRYLKPSRKPFII